MAIDWQPFETMPLDRDVFVFSDDGDVDVASKTKYGGGFHTRTGEPVPVRYSYSPTLVGGYEWDWDLGESSIIAWAEIPDDKPSWYVPKPPHVPMTDEERAEILAKGYKNPLFRAADVFYGGVIVRVTDEDTPFVGPTIGDTLKIRAPDLR